METTAPLSDAKLTKADVDEDADMEEGYEIMILLLAGNFSEETIVNVALPIFWTKLLYAAIVKVSTVVLIAV